MKENKSMEFLPIFENKYIIALYNENRFIMF